MRQPLAGLEGGRPVVQESELEEGAVFEGSPFPRRRRKVNRTTIRTRW